MEVGGVLETARGQARLVMGLRPPVTQHDSCQESTTFRAGGGPVPGRPQCVNQLGDYPQLSVHWEDR
jgi:hypothetical protein